MKRMLYGVPHGRALRTTQELVSTGHASVSLAVPMSKLLRCIERLKLEPALKVNGVSYFDVEQMNKIHAELRKPRKQLSAIDAIPTVASF